MKRAAVMAVLLAAAAAWGASAAYGRALPVQRDFVRPLEFGDGADAADLRAAPDVAMAIERREAFAREQKGEKKSLLALGGGRRVSGNAAAYYSDTSEEGEEGRSGAKRSDWLVQSLTKGGGGTSSNGQSGVRGVFSPEGENGALSWGWLAEEVAQRQGAEASEDPSEEPSEELSEEDSEGGEEMAVIAELDIPATVAVAPNSTEERDARRDEIRNAAPPVEPAKFAELPAPEEKPRNPWGPDVGEGSAILVMRERPMGVESAYERTSKVEVDYTPSAGGFRLPSGDTGGGAGRLDTGAWGAGERAAGIGWRGSTDSGSAIISAVRSAANGGRNSCVGCKASIPTDRWTNDRPLD